MAVAVEAPLNLCCGAGCTYVLREAFSMYPPFFCEDERSRSMYLVNFAYGYLVPSGRYRYSNGAKTPHLLPR